VKVNEDMAFLIGEILDAPGFQSVSENLVRAKVLD
jgi:hypothetical protein